MMKPKRKAAPANHLVRLWREFLFTREFEFEANLSLEDCAIALQHLPETLQLTQDAREHRQIALQSASSKTIEFHIEHQKRTSSSRKFTSVAVAKGKLIAVNQVASTLIVGDAQFSGTRLSGLLLVGIAAGLFFASGFNSLSNAGSQGFALILAIIWVMSLLRDWSAALRERNQLIAAIEGQITIAERDTRLQQRKSQQPALDIAADSFPSQKSKR